MSGQSEKNAESALDRLRRVLPFDGSVSVLAFTASGFVTAFVYEYAFARFAGIPTWFIQLDVPKVSFGLLSEAAVVLGVFAFTEVDWETIIPRTWHWTMFGLGLVLFLPAVFALPMAVASLETQAVFLGSWALMVNMLLAVMAWLKGLRYRLWPRPLMPMVLVATPWAVGSMHALMRQDYWWAPEKQRIVVRTYGDTAVCAKYDVGDSTCGPGFEAIKVTDLGKLQYIHTGCLQMLHGNVDSR